MIKLIATDLDNTLLDRQGQVPQSTLDVLAQAREKGIDPSLLHFWFDKE